MSRFVQYVRVMSKKMWPKVTAYALLGITSALAAWFFKGWISDDLSEIVSRDTAQTILTILASSMLAVTTFSLSTMVAAYSAATTNVTPRATRLITEDKATQNALSTFLGSFLFSLVGIIALNMGIYEGSGRFILFAVTLGVIVLIIVTLIRWVDRLTELGRVSETSRLVEEAATKAMRARAEKPSFDCNSLANTGRREWKTALDATECGYVQYVDIAAMDSLAEENGLDVCVTAMPGKYVTSGYRLALLSAEPEPDCAKDFRECFTLGQERTFEQDPRFGLCVLAEIACRAMSTAINDTGTAIDIVARLGRVLEVYATRCEDPATVRYKRVWVTELQVPDLFDDAFKGLVRDSAAVYEVQTRIMKCLKHLGGLHPDYAVSASRYSDFILRYAEEKMVLAEDVTELRRQAKKIAGSG